MLLSLNLLLLAMKTQKGIAQLADVLKRVNDYLACVRDRELSKSTGSVLL